MLQQKWLLDAGLCESSFVAILGQDPGNPVTLRMSGVVHSLYFTVTTGNMTLQLAPQAICPRCRPQHSRLQAGDFGRLWCGRSVLSFVLSFVLNSGSISFCSFFSPLPFVSCFMWGPMCAISIAVIFSPMVFTASVTSKTGGMGLGSCLSHL